MTVSSAPPATPMPDSPPPRSGAPGRRLLGAMWGWFDDRTGTSAMFRPLLNHTVPPTGWDYTIGSAAMVAFIVQVVTGVALAFTYVPSPDDAYQSLDFITNQAILGSVVRGIHYWGASAMVLLVCVHCAQVFLIGAFKYPREVNWLSGTMLLLFTFVMAFTGQLLRWNQDAYWAVVVGAAQAARAPVVGEWLTGILFAGGTIGGATLTRFYATHVFLVPAAIIGLIAWHVYLAMYHGVSEPPQAGRPVDRRTYKREYKELLHKVGVPFFPDAIWKDMVFAVVVGSVVLVLAIVVGPATLGKQADPTVVQADPRPDWYFLWYFALLALVPPRIEDWFIIGFPLALGLLFVLLPFIAPTGERSPKRRPWAIGVVGVFFVSIGALVYQGWTSPWSPNMEASTLPSTVTAELTGDATEGAQLFEQKGCQNCHTIAGTGGRRGPDLSHIGRQLTRDELTWRILSGGTNMPAYGDSLQPEDVTALLDFLQTRQ